MIHASLCSGAGGFDLAAEAMGWTNLFNCEIDPIMRRVLKFYFKNAIQHADIFDTDFTIYRGRVDVLSAGFPCQPFSRSGKGKGKEDERHLWPEIDRAIGEIRPAVFLGENVRGLLDKKHRDVLNQVTADLESKDYSVLRFLLPANAIGAPDERYRVWFIAYSDSKRCRQFNLPELSGVQKQPSRLFDEKESTNSQGIGWLQRNEWTKGERPTCPLPDWRQFPIESPFLRGDHGLSNRLDGVTIPQIRRNGIKAMGNAVKPQFPYLIFKTIEQIILSEK